MPFFQLLLLGTTRRPRYFICHRDKLLCKCWKNLNKTLSLGSKFIKVIITVIKIVIMSASLFKADFTRTFRNYQMLINVKQI